MTLRDDIRKIIDKPLLKSIPGITGYEYTPKADVDAICQLVAEDKSRLRERMQGEKYTQQEINEVSNYPDPQALAAMKFFNNGVDACLALLDGKED